MLVSRVCLILIFPQYSDVIHGKARCVPPSKNVLPSRTVEEVSRDLYKSSFLGDTSQGILQYCIDSVYIFILTYINNFAWHIYIYR